MKTLVAAAVLLLTSSAWAATPNVAGKWSVHTSISDTEHDQTCTFVQKGESLTGACTLDQGSANLTGTVEGASVTWKYASEYQGTPFTATYQGKLDGNTITGTTDIDAFNVSGEFTATRVR